MDRLLPTQRCFLYWWRNVRYLNAKPRDRQTPEITRVFHATAEWNNINISISYKNFRNKKSKKIVRFSFCNCQACTNVLWFWLLRRSLILVEKPNNLKSISNKVQLHESMLNPLWYLIISFGEILWTFILLRHVTYWTFWTTGQSLSSSQRQSNQGYDQHVPIRIHYLLDRPSSLIQYPISNTSSNCFLVIRCRYRGFEH